MTTIQLNGEFSLVKGSTSPNGRQKVCSSFLRFMGDRELEKYVTGSRERGFTNYLDQSMRKSTTRESFATALNAVGIKNFDTELFTIYVN